MASVSVYRFGLLPDPRLPQVLHNARPHCVAVLSPGTKLGGVEQDYIRKEKMGKKEQKNKKTKGNPHTRRCSNVFCWNPPVLMQCISPNMYLRRVQLVLQCLRRRSLRRITNTGGQRRKEQKTKGGRKVCCLARHSVLPLYISLMTIAHPAPKQTREDRKRTGYMLLSERKSSSLLLDMARRASFFFSIWFWINFVRKIH